MLRKCSYPDRLHGLRWFSSREGDRAQLTPAVLIAAMAPCRSRPITALTIVKSEITPRALGDAALHFIAARGATAAPFVSAACSSAPTTATLADGGADPLD